MRRQRSEQKGKSSLPASTRVRQVGQRSALVFVVDAFDIPHSLILFRCATKQWGRACESNECEMSYGQGRDVLQDDVGSWVRWICARVSLDFGAGLRPDGEESSGTGAAAVAGGCYVAGGGGKNSSRGEGEAGNGCCGEDDAAGSCL